MAEKMMRRLFQGCLAALVWVVMSAGPAVAGYDYIDITNPYIKKIPTAVPRFQNSGGDERAETIAREAARLLEDTLDFTGYFKIVDHGAFLEYPHETGISAEKINFRNWTGIGAELLITGGAQIQDGNLLLELRLFDTFKSRLLIGKRYSSKPEDQRKIIRKFCAEVVRLLTGREGLFDSKIVFVSSGTGAKEVFICDFDGYDPRQLTNTKRISLSPALAPDGQHLAYTDYSRGKPDLYIKNLRNHKTWVVDQKGVNITPAWLPGAFTLAATLSFSGDQEIYLLTGAGKMIKRLTRNWGIDVSPSFSPDGRQMAFVSKRAGTPQIYIQDLQTDQVRRLTFEGRYNTSPAWSPRGDKIAYASSKDGRFNIYIIGTDGNYPRALTQQAGDNESPTWSPDGSLIAFSSSREGVERIYVMTVFGTDQRRLLTLPGAQTQPKWSTKIDNN
ncbi:MAG: Tol-Pal system beta propeller repeat protein TolB [Thermodesulfobacteriota bacterium]